MFLLVSLLACQSPESVEVDPGLETPGGADNYPIDTSETGVETDSGSTTDSDPATTDPTTTPVYPTPFPASFHIVDRDDIYTYDSIVGLVNAYRGPLITSQNPPKTVDHLHWAQNISVTWYADGAEMAAAVDAALTPVDSAPMFVMIDEVRSESIQLVADAAVILARDYPRWAGRWGAYLVNGEGVGYDGLNPAVDALLDANAVIVAEMYADQDRYCASYDSAGSRDVWLAAWFAGESEGFGKRFGWLANRRNEMGSASQLQVLFGVTETYMNGTNPAIFLDRMFYVWMTRSGFPSTLSLANGGVGAYKWDDPYNSNTSRDLAFADSFDHYVVQGLTSSRQGQVDCD